MRALALLTVLLVALAPVRAGDDDGLRNPGFEEGAVGETPPGWFLPPVSRNAGFKVEVSAEEPFEGKTSAFLRYMQGTRPRAFGNLMQSIDATPYRGRRVRLKAAIRIHGYGIHAQMWMRVDREGGARGFFDNMGDRPIREMKWKEVEIEGDIHDDARSINVGVMLMGGGAVYIDAFTLEDVGDALPPFEPEAPRALHERALENVVAFAKLLGYVRYFHPSDEAAAAKWDKAAIAGVREVESAKDAKELAARLESFFRPLAPTLVVRPTSRLPKRAPGTERPTGDGPYFVRQFHHQGLGPEDGGLYRSARRRVPVPAKGLPDGVVDPAHAFRADLGGGVACRMPLALYADADGTLPRASGSPPWETLPRNHVATGNDRATRLADVILAWNVFQHFYPYFDVVPASWDEELPKALGAAAEDDGERAFLDTLRRMVAGLHDGHGNVVHASDDRRLRLPLRWDWIEDQLVVTQVGEPLKRILSPGDVVERIDYEETSKALAEAESLISGATPQWRRYRALNEIARRSSEDPVELHVRSLAVDDGKRTVLAVPGSFQDTPPEPRPEKIAELEPGIWYVDLDRISSDDFKASLSDLAAAKGIVFDMRGYPSKLGHGALFPHLVKEPGTSAQWRVPVLTRPDREDMECPRRPGWRIAPKAPYLEAKRAFLLDGRAISYAESCMGIVEHYGLGEIVGAPSAGTNGNVNPFALPGGYRVMWTGMQVLKHDGSQHHGVGILPTIPVSRTRAGVVAGRDEILEAGVAAVKR